MSGRAPAPVVGIGASAGGLEALKALLGAMPPKPGLVFVVVVHLAPEHESLMPELLARATSLTVAQAHDRQPLEPDHVYIIPANRLLSVDQGLLRVREVADRRGLRGVIDHFLRSLAEEQRDRAIAIVLSGTGTEGTLGARAVKAQGGLVIAQTPDTASQPGMPASVVAAGLADMVLAPDKMPDALVKYVRRAHRAPVRTAEPAATAPGNIQPVLAVLRARRKYDFRGYKQGTLHRRIERRMGLQQIASISKYVELLRSHPDEADLLFKDLLIGVTAFFRDPAAFDELATVLAALVRERDQDASIRIWVPGCATGEEAYSIAMVVAEQLSAAQSACRVQIFATDVDETALDLARGGTYPESIALDVTPQRLQRFFTRHDHRYTIEKSLRESVVFAAQNLMSDPPFSKLDLIACRNVLIYLEPDVQEKLITLFHFALIPGGYLFLGNAEGIGPLDRLFGSVSKRQRLFRRVGPVVRPPIDFPSSVRAHGKADQPARAAEPEVAALADQQLLEHFAPAAVVIRRNGHISRFYGAMDRYMNWPVGEATLDLLALARDALKPTLRALLHDAVRHHREKVLETVDFDRGKGRMALRITARPLRLPQAANDLWLLIFEERPFARVESTTGKPSSVTRRLEAELRATKREQQHLVEQLESSNEELKAANEEILSMNEELQSTNEELVTSKEELQSMNEELTTLNAQLQDKVHELTTVNDDLANLLVSTDIATVFIDTDLRIKRFTTAATHMLNLMPSDAGRPISHLATNLLHVDLSRDASAVLDSLTPISREVEAEDGKHYMVRVFPYRTEDRTVEGVVLTLVDVTLLKETERELKTARDELRQVNQALERQVAERTNWLALIHAGTRTLDEAPSATDALRRVLHGLCEIENWQVGHLYLPDAESPDTFIASVSYISDERFQPFHRLCTEQRYTPGQGLPGRVAGDGEPVWANDETELFGLLPIRAESARRAGLRAVAALPISVSGKVAAVLELFSVHPHLPSPEIVRLMQDVMAQLAHVLEREQIADLVWREQQDLLHALHDSLGQTLAGLGMLGVGLAHRLTTAGNPAAEDALAIATQVQHALEQVRLLARDLYPVEVASEGLPAALRQLATTTESLHKIQVRAEVDPAAPVQDGRLAMQLYRIAQEAVTNAVKHAGADLVTVHLRVEAGVTILQVSDNGIGIRDSGSRGDGVGLGIMRHRAQSIGGTLALRSDADGGTTVTVTVRRGLPMSRRT